MTAEQTSAAGTDLPASVTQAVLVASEPVPEGVRQVRGVDFHRTQGRDITVAELVDHMGSMGFQASAIGDAVRIINDMVSDRLFLFVSFFFFPFQSYQIPSGKRTRN